jgi:polyisoprenoid-binding protein YceI
MTTMTRLSELTGDYVLDTTQTRIGFVARHTIGPKVRGQFDEFEGRVHLDGDVPSKSSAHVTIQAKSIQTGNQRRDEPVSSKFLDADNHQAITFTSTEVEQVNETNFKVTGDLTIRGVTKPVTVDFVLTAAHDDPRGNFQVRFGGSVTIARKDWGVRWIAAAGMVSDKVALEFVVAATRQS